MNTLRVHDLVPFTKANGPGARACLWLQGCSLACPGCFNPETHDFAAGKARDCEELAREILALPNIEGVTVSGGEPLQQASGLMSLLEIIRSESNLSVIIFSGFHSTEIETMPCAAELKSLCDVVVAGRYMEQKHLGKGLLGSSNQQILLYSDRYSLLDFEDLPPSEVIIAEDGTIILSGVDPLSI